MVSCLILTGCHTTTSEKLPASGSEQTAKVSEDKKDEKRNQTQENIAKDSEKTTQEATKEENSEDASKEKSKVSNSKKETPSVKTPAKEETSKPQTKTQTTAKTPTTPATKPASVEEKKQTVTMSIIGADGYVVFAKQEVEWKEGDTVLDVLLRVTKAHKIQMEYSGGKKAAYVEGIDNLYEFDKGEGSGWMYGVNGVYVQVSCGSCSVKKGDVISWRYTKNLGEDLGAKTE